MKLSTKYNRIHLTTTIILLFLTSIAFYFIISGIFTHELDEKLDDYRASIEKFINRHHRLPSPNVIEDVIISFEPTTEKHMEESYARIDQFREKLNRLHDYRQLTYLQALGNQHYKVTIQKPYEGVRLLTMTTLYTTIAVLLLSIIISILLNQLLLRKLWHPFYQSIQKIKDFDISEQKSISLPVSGTDEFDFLNNSLSKTFNKAQADYLILKEFTENASHEMQTPLAIIRSKLDLLIQEEELTCRQMELLASSYKAIKKISKLNTSLLLLAKIDNQQFTKTERIDLLTEMQLKLDQFKEFWCGSNIKVNTQLSPSQIHINENLLDILLNNLLANAGLHNHQGGKIGVWLKEKELVISNTGTHQPLDPHRLFRRFYKASSSSTQNGLGLSIIKQICDHSQIHIHYSFSGLSHSFKLSW